MTTSDYVLSSSSKYIFISSFPSYGKSSLNVNTAKPLNSWTHLETPPPTGESPRVRCRQPLIYVKKKKKKCADLLTVYSFVCAFQLSFICPSQARGALTIAHTHAHTCTPLPAALLVLQHSFHQPLTQCLTFDPRMFLSVWLNIMVRLLWHPEF